MSTTHAYDYDVVIIGAGLAGLSLARQLLLNDGAVTILQIDKRLTIPQKGQKVGEATVQVSGYYFSKVLELEEYYSQIAASVRVRFAADGGSAVSACDSFARFFDYREARDEEHLLGVRRHPRSGCGLL